MSSAISVMLTEWSEQLFEGVYLETASDRLLAQELMNSGILEIVELRSGVRIRSNSFVGRVSLGNMRVQITPKLRGMPLMILLQHTYGLRNLTLIRQAGFDIDRLNFFDLLIYTLYSYAENLINRGVLKGYTSFEEDRTCVKGRIDIRRLTAHGGIIAAALPCQYYERNENTILNQVLLAGMRLAGRFATDVNLHHNVMRICERLAFLAEDIVLSKQVLIAARRSITRLNDIYKPSLELINILYEAHSIQLENGETERVSLPGFFFDMNVFFEALVAKLLNNISDQYSIVDQYRIGSLFAYEPRYNPKNKRSPIPRPDFALLKNGVVVQLLDAKYRDLWNESLPRDMLYQLAVYAASGIGNNTATILYPAMNNLPTLQQINISNPFTSEPIAKILMKPINLVQTADYIKGGEMEKLAHYFTEIICS